MAKKNLLHTLTGKKKEKKDLLFRVLDFRSPVITKASGLMLTDEDERNYLDFASGQLCSCLGHSHPRLVGAITEQVGKSIHLGSRFLSDSVLEAAEKFAAITPKKLEKTVFLSTGTEANEFALRCGKAYNEKNVVAGFDRGYYGSSNYMGGLSHPGNKRGITYPAEDAAKITTPYCARCPLNKEYPSCSIACIEKSREELDRFDGQVSSFIVEPVLSAGGMIVPPKGYFKKLSELAREHDALLVADEAQTGLGRTGRWFGFEHWGGVVPDVLVVSKSAGGGYPVSAVITSREIEEGVRKKGFSHISSHMNDPLGAKVFSTVVDVIGKERLVENAESMGAYLKEKLDGVKARHAEVVSDVRGAGLMVGVELSGDGEATEKKAMSIESSCLENGLVLGYGSFYGVFRLCPPLTVTKEDIDEAAAIFERALAEE
ncbi:MAG: aspartate aminotransferase family protein [Candidatus Altiarchaeota archaeon]